MKLMLIYINGEINSLPSGNKRCFEYVLLHVLKQPQGIFG